MDPPGGARSTFSIEHSDVSGRVESANWPYRPTSIDWIACGPLTCAVIVRAPVVFGDLAHDVPVEPQVDQCPCLGRAESPADASSFHDASTTDPAGPDCRLSDAAAVARSGSHADLQALRPRLANVAAGFADRCPGMAGSRSDSNEPRHLEDLSHRLGMRRRIGCGQTAEVGCRSRRRPFRIRPILGQGKTIQNLGLLWYELHGRWR